MKKNIVIATCALMLIGCNIPNSRDRRLAERDSAIIILQSQLIRSIQQTNTVMEDAHTLIVISRKQQLQIDSLINKYNLLKKNNRNEQ